MTRRHVALAALLVLSGCGVRPTGVIGAGEGPVATATSTPQAQVVFFGDGLPVAVRRPVNPSDEQAVMDALVAGPTPDEAAKGLTTALTVRKIVTRYEDGHVLIVDPLTPPGGLSPDAYTQISCTIALLPGPPDAKIVSSIEKKLAGMGVRSACPPTDSPSAPAQRLPSPWG
jgi:hypothetical protein